MRESLPEEPVMDREKGQDRCMRKIARKDNNNLSDRLVEKSIEAFILGLEVFNKPTICYRIEGFSFFICNAWELMLKAHLINLNDGDDSIIYYKNEPSRTISLLESIGRIYTDKHQPLRINLEEINELRNTSTHFVTEDYETIYAPLFQACVLNYGEQLKRFHNIDITEYTSPNFLTLSANIDILSNEEIRGKYSKAMAERLISKRNEIAFLTSNNPSNAFSIPIRHEFYKTKNKSEADFIYTVSPDSTEPVKHIKVVVDPQDKYTLSFNNVIQAVNTNLEAKNIPFNYCDSKGNNRFNSYALSLIVTFYSMKESGRFCYYFDFVNTTRYSQQAVEFIVDVIKKDADIIAKIKNTLKKR